VISRRDDLVRAADRGVGTRADRLTSVEREIRRAQAEALGRVGERLQALLDRVAAMDRRLDALQAALDRGAGPDPPPFIRAEVDARNRVRDQAARVRHDLIIQREALGMARHGAVEHCYPVPARRRLPGGGPASEERTS
jgi:hypothetical protein